MSRYIELMGIDEPIIVEIDDSESAGMQMIRSNDISSSLSNATNAIISNGKKIITSMQELEPDEVQLEVGIKGGIEAGMPVWSLAKISNEGNITIKLKWKK